MRGRRPAFNLNQNVDRNASPADSFRLEVKLPDSVKLPSSPPMNPKHAIQDGLDLSKQMEDLELNGDNESTPQVEPDATPYV
jgi:hypothetical protein